MSLRSQSRFLSRVQSTGKARQTTTSKPRFAKATDKVLDENWTDVQWPVILPVETNFDPLDSSLLEDECVDLDFVDCVEYFELSYRQAHGVDVPTAASNIPPRPALSQATTTTPAVILENGDDADEQRDQEHDTIGDDYVEYVDHHDHRPHTDEDENSFGCFQSGHTKAGKCTPEPSHESGSDSEYDVLPISPSRPDYKISDYLLQNLEASLEASWSDSHDLLLLRTQCESFF